MQATFAPTFLSSWKNKKKRRRVSKIAQPVKSCKTWIEILKFTRRENCVCKLNNRPDFVENKKSKTSAKLKAPRFFFVLQAKRKKMEKEKRATF